MRRRGFCRDRGFTIERFLGEEIVDHCQQDEEKTQQKRLKGVPLIILKDCLIHCKVQREERICG